MNFKRITRGIAINSTAVLLLAALIACGVSTKPGNNKSPLEASKVAIVQSSKAKAENLNYSDILAMVSNAIEQAGGFKGFITNGMTVVLKPNLVVRNDYTTPGWTGPLIKTEVSGNCTDWRVTRAVVEIVRHFDPDGKVYVMEGSAQEPTKIVMEYLKYTPEFIPGVTEFIAIEQDSGGYRDVTSTNLVKKDLPNGLQAKTFYLNRRYYEADVLISLPCLKNHWNAAISGSIKNIGIGATPANIYGTHNGSGNNMRTSMVNHDTSALHKWIHDFYMCRPVNFAIMDALQGLQNGPTPSYEISKSSRIEQDQKNMRLILASRDPIALDTIAALVMEWDPESVLHLKYLSDDRMGNLDTGNIIVAGKEVDEVRKDFAGVTPTAGGGSKIADKTPPDLSIDKFSMEGNILHLSLKADQKTRKIQIYCDGALMLPLITHDFNDMSVSLGKIAAGKHEIRVDAYDRFLNRTEKTLEVAAE